MHQSPEQWAVFLFVSSQCRSQPRRQAPFPSIGGFFALMRQELLPQVPALRSPPRSEARLLCRALRAPRAGAAGSSSSECTECRLRGWKSRSSPASCLCAPGGEHTRCACAHAKGGPGCAALESRAPPPAALPAQSGRAAALAQAAQLLPAALGKTSRSIADRWSLSCMPKQKKISVRLPFLFGCSGLVLFFQKV